MIERYIQAMKDGDAKALSECFAMKCRYFDYCPIGTKGINYHIFGRPAIEMFFLHKFTFRIVSVSDAIVEDENSANFVVVYDGNYFNAKATIEKYSEDGLIEDLIVRPA